MHMSDICKEIAILGKGIGNENRYRILESLMRGPLTVGEIAKKVALPQPAVSQHLKILKSSSLVEDERQGQEVRVFGQRLIYDESTQEVVKRFIPQEII